MEEEEQNYKNSKEEPNYKKAKEDIDEDGDGDELIGMNEEQSENNLVSLEDLKIDTKRDVLLMFGSEGSGLSHTLSRIANFQVSIPP
jgi:tRNA G18 (ribose-2'-O)-methylase SpoU